MKRRIRVGLLFGGRSAEHAVSLASARAVIEAIDQSRYEMVPIGITRQGAWLLGHTPALLAGDELPLEQEGTFEVVADVTRKGLVPLPRAGFESMDPSRESAVDVVFPLLHGPYGEDGTVQGLLELADVAYVGTGVLGSAVGMDKGMMKMAFEHHGLPVVPYRCVALREWQREPDAVIASLEASLTYPMFVKPSNLGSSIGISKARDANELRDAMGTAGTFDRRIVVEQGIDAREVECAVLGNEDLAVSVFGEIVPHHEFYDYEAKYTDGLTDFIVPARLGPEQARTMTDMAMTAFRATDAAGMARVDFFVRRGTGTIFVNEINTIPGFTPTSMYPKLWAASGIDYGELIDRLLQLALERHAEKHRRAH